MRFTRKIIGFRSGRRKNKVIASIGYFLFIVGLLGQVSSGPTPWDSFVHTLAWTLLFLCVVFPVANVLSIRKRLFFFNRLSKRGRTFGILGYAVVSLIIFGLIDSGLESATAKQLEAKQQVVAAKSAQASQGKANQEAQAKADQQAQAKGQAETQTKADQEAQAKAQAEAQAKAQQEAQAKAQAEAQAKAQQEAQAKAQQEAQAKAQAQAQAQAQQATVQILSVSDPAPRNSIATLTAKVAPNATAEIAVHYESGDSTAQGLGPKQADANGNVSWSWHVGGRTTLGTWPITVSCNGASADTQFTVIH